jgi:hypothetical protein
MATAATVIQSLETYEWNTQLYGVLSVASRLAVAVKKKGHVLRLSLAFRKANHCLESMFEKVRMVMDGKIPVNPNTEPVTPQVIRRTYDTLIHLHQTMKYISESCERAGLGNNSLTASALRKFHIHQEAILDLADWFEVASEPEQIIQIFDRAKREIEQGDVFDLDSVE